MPPDSLSEIAWNTSECTLQPLDLNATLRSGQAFRWRQDGAGVWWGSIGSAAVALWQKTGDPASTLYWQTFPRADQRALIEEYFRLDVRLDQLYAEWTDTEPQMREIVQRFRGLRILRQPPLECFLAFQCATCNTVVKIQRTVTRLAERYGALILPQAASSDVPRSFQGEPPQSPGEPQTPIYAFPDSAAIAGASDADLRADLWGFRAPRVTSLARHLEICGPSWLTDLRNVPYPQAKAALVALPGIGEKVADCICLFALGKDEAVPVDTHVRRIACHLFLPQFEDKSLTPRVYSAIADAYRSRFGSYAGWAQQYLFLGALRHKKS